MLSQVPCKSAAFDGSPKDIESEFTHNLIEISSAIHNYSFEIFAYRVNKHKHKLSDIQTFIAQDRTHFKHEHRRTSLTFLQHVNMIIKTVADAQATKQFSTGEIGLFLKIYSTWTQRNLPLKNALASNRFTLLDDADTWPTKSASSDT